MGWGGGVNLFWQEAINSQQGYMGSWDNEKFNKQKIIDFFPLWHPSTPIFSGGGKKSPNCKKKKS